jgi:hypothetical protein
VPRDPSGPGRETTRSKLTKSKFAACSFGWWLMAGVGLFGEKNIVGWLLVTGLF